MDESNRLVEEKVSMLVKIMNAQVKVTHVIEPLPTANGVLHHSKCDVLAVKSTIRFFSLFVRSNISYLITKFL